MAASHRSSRANVKIACALSWIREAMSRSCLTPSGHWRQRVAILYGRRSNTRTGYEGPREAEGPSDACRGLREAEESAGERGGVEWAEVVEGLSYANQFDWHAKFVRDRECDAALGRAV